MISNWLAATLGRRNIHYGWVMVGVTFLTALISAGTVGAPGVFIIPLQKEFGWSTAEISSALSIRFILFGLMAPFAAALLNRYGLRNVTLLAQLIVVSGLILSLGMTEVWQLVVLWGVVIGLGTGMTALVLGATIATRWFAARRGLVVGILTASVATGQLVFLPLLASLTERYGWRLALGFVCIALCVSALGVLLVMRDRPSDVGLRPFGDEGTEPLPAPPVSHGSITAVALGTLRDASKSRAFWVLFATFFVCGASTNGLVQVHLIPMCLDFGIPQVQAAGLLAAMGIFDFFGTIMSGLAVGPLRQPLPLVLVLRPARALTDLPPLQRFLVLWALDLRDVLRARLDRNRAAHGAPHRAEIRTRARQSGVRLDLCRPPARRGHRRLRRRVFADGVSELSSRLLHRRRTLRVRLLDRADALETTEAKAASRDGLVPDRGGDAEDRSLDVEIARAAAVIWTPALQRTVKATLRCVRGARLRINFFHSERMASQNARLLRTHGFAFSRLISPELCSILRTLSQKRAQGRPGAGWHPQSRVRTRRARGGPQVTPSNRPSLREWFYGL
ncbi:MFS family permease [Bradyrhizobium sp. LM2.9]